jgi:signal transduction histidine kinase/ActR/RegA family two-component response regulator
MQEDRTYPSDLRRIATNGLAARVLARLWPWKVGRGAPRGPSPQERAEQQVRRGETRLREVIDALPGGVVLFDREGRYVLWNERYAEIHPQSADLFAVGRRLADALRAGAGRGDHPDAVGREEAWLAEQLAFLDNPGQRHEQRLADGRWVLIEERRTRDGGAIGLCIDVSDLKGQVAVLETALQRAGSVNRSKSEFLANMSQQIRTPLNSVLSMADVLARSALDPGQRDAVESIVASATQLHRVLGDLLDLSRLETGQIQIRPAAFALSELLDEVMADHQPAARAKGLVLEASARLALGAEVVGDPVRLKQVLNHLVGNAIKFTERGFVELSVTPGDGAHDYRFEVRDSGVGFAPDQAERLFGAFEQADGAHSGAGLGLTLCRQLAGAMGGAITAAGHPGRGAIFALTAPLAAVEQTRPAREHTQQAAGGAPRVLVVDDNDVSRKLVELILKTIAADVVAVENGLEAVRAVEQARFDLVLMDLQMPVMDGLTAIRRIRAFEAAGQRPRMPIVVLSANVMPQHLEASAAAGADGHIGKPVSVEQLIAAVRGALGGESASAAKVA